MTDQKAQLEFNAMDYLALFWRRRKLFLIPFVLMTAAGIGFGSLIPKGYESKTITKVTERSYIDKLYKGLDVAPPPTIEPNSAEFEFTSRDTVEEILEGQGMLANCRTELERQEAVDRVRERIEVQVISPKMGGGDKMLIVKFTGTSPDRAQLIVKRVTEKNLARLKMAYRAEIRKMRDKAAMEFERREAAYQEAQDRLQEFEEQHLEALMGGDSPLLERKIERDREKLEETVSEIQRLDGVIKLQRFALSNTDRELIDHDRLENPKYAPIASEVQILEGELTTLKANRNPDHPIVRQKEEVYRKRKKILDQTPRWLRNVEIRKPNPKWEEANLKLEKAEADQKHLLQLRVQLTEQIKMDEQRLKALPGIRKEHAARKSNVDQAHESMIAYADRLEQADTTHSRVTETLDQLFVAIERASRPLKHSTPPAVLIWLISLALGLAAGVGTVFAIEMGSKTFHSPEDVSALLKWPVIGVVHTILSEEERRQRARKRAAAVVATLIVVIGVSTVVYIYNRNPDLLPDFLVDSVQKVREIVG
jgi:capsular polysaccharide biosynthesis protein